MNPKTRKLIKRIIRAALATVLVLEMSDPVRAADKLNAAWQLEVDAAGRYVELLRRPTQ
jgi:hypothetical protein